MCGEEGVTFFESVLVSIGAEDDAFLGDACFEGVAGAGGEGSAGGEFFTTLADGEVEVVVFEVEGPAVVGAALGGDYAGGGEAVELGGDGEGAVGDVGGCFGGEGVAGFEVEDFFAGGF